jgi:hypothetical protein
MKMKMRTAGKMAVIAVACALSCAVSATAETMAWPDAAPAADAAVEKPSWMNYKDPYAGEQNNAANPNRTPEEIASWTSRAATEALSLTPDTINARIVETKKSFSPAGWTEFAEYMRRVQMIELVRDKKYSVATILNGDAVVMNSGAVSGVYRWLVHAPLLITFTQINAKGEAEPKHSGNFKLVMQLGRAADDKTGRDGLQIESWKMEAVDNAATERR